MSSTGKSLVWFITGASGGFGHQLTQIVLSRGDRVIATARSLNQRLKALESDSCKLIQLDVTESEESIKAKAKQAVAIWGRVDVLVNNAGIGCPGICEEAGAAGFVKQFNINVFGTMNVTNAFLPYMRAARSGILVFIGSRHAWMTKSPGLAPYNSSKAAIHAYAETLQNEVAQFGIRVFIPQPGAHRTDIITSSSNNSITREKIPDYDHLREAGLAKYSEMNGKQPGDPYKAMSAIVDVVRGEGMAAGKEIPLWLVLGSDAEQNLRDHIADKLKNLDEWEALTRSTTIPNGN